MILTAKVISVRQLRKTQVKHPGFEFVTDQGTYQTEDNTNVNHIVAPESQWVGKTCRFAIDRRKIRGIVLLD